MFDEKKWARHALQSQRASNASGVMHSALSCLKEWRNSGGDFNGKDCIPLRMMCFQIAFLSGAGDGIAYNGDYKADYDKMKELSDD